MTGPDAADWAHRLVLAGLAPGAGLELQHALATLDAVATADADLWAVLSLQTMFAVVAVQQLARARGVPAGELTAELVGVLNAGLGE